MACFFLETTCVGVSQPSAKEKVVLSSGCMSPTKNPEAIYLGYFPCKILKLLHNLQGAGIIMCLFDMTCIDLTEADSTLHTKICYFFSLLMQCKLSATQISWCCKHCLQRNAESLTFSAMQQDRLSWISGSLDTEISKCNAMFLT